MKLKHRKGSLLVKVDLEFKNSHKFKDGTVIKLERGVENLNKRETQPVNGIVVSAENIPSGSQILIHHNAVHEVNRLYDYQPLSGKVEADTIRYYSIPEEECFLWREKDNDQWNPCYGFATALRVFKPYNGSLLGIEPTLIKNVLYITSGEFKGRVAHVLHASDYTIVFQGDNGVEENIIRIRHFEKKYNEREEITATDSFLTSQVKKGELLVGLTPLDAKVVG